MFCSLKKRQFFHTWTQWKIIDKAKIKNYGKVVGVMIVQQRECKECGYIQYKKEEIVTDLV